MSSINTPVVNPQKYFGNASPTHSRSSGAGVVAIVLPAANVNGVIVYFASNATTAVGYTARSVMATAAPVGITDGAALSVHFAGNGDYNLSVPFLVPVGFGLYYQGNHATGTGDIFYEVL